MTMRELWDHEAVVDERYATLAWGGDGSPEQVQPTIDAIIENLTSVLARGPAEMMVLEIGCGPGRLLHRLARAFPPVFFCGFDVSAEMLALGEWDRPANVMVVQRDGTSLTTGFAEGREGFDFIYSVEVFQHIDLEAKADYLRQISKILTPDGLVLIQYVHGYGPSEGPLHHPIDEVTFAALVKSAGLKVRKIKVPNQVHDVWRWVVVSR